MVPGAIAIACSALSVEGLVHWEGAWCFAALRRSTKIGVGDGYRTRDLLSHRRSGTLVSGGVLWFLLTFRPGQRIALPEC
jgi:hypothetical protein